MTIIFASVTYSIIIISQLNLQAEVAIKYLNNARQLYWYFNNQIVENRGTKDFTKVSINEISTIETYLLNQLNLIPKVELLSIEEFITQNNLSKYFENKIVQDSAIIKIKNITLDPQVITGWKYQEKIFYIGQKKTGSVIKRSLYQYANNYSDEVVPDVRAMNVRKVSKNNIDYYFFSFWFESYHQALPNIISFVIADYS